MEVLIKKIEKKGTPTKQNVLSKIKRFFDKNTLGDKSLYKMLCNKTDELI